ncbi:MAG: deoxyguanosinetriphosphate triphosphohydrolase [Gammaproteobacteria bacterium]|nr:MAG: deoxyguanosinetriphosphate triphosphohydrolase [Gammaproteobacteria bacterium]
MDGRSKRPGAASPRATTARDQHIDSVATPPRPRRSAQNQRKLPGPVPAVSGHRVTVPAHPCAASEATSRGRRYPESPHPYRGMFQRDRDRIVHCAAFRRLVYKTQVFVNHEGDLYRTRLTHSLEVAQIARTVAAGLGLEPHLTEAICLAHDLGHTPFGHSGQEALNRCMRPWGGFEHNLQSLRVVDEIEQRYLAFPGLNLTFETREGILKHCSQANAVQLGELGRRFIERRQPSLEAQLANVADEIAYSNHDMDDGLRAGLLRIVDLEEVALFRRHFSRLRAAHRRGGRRILIHETVRRMIDHVVTDLIETSRCNIAGAAAASLEAVRARRQPLIGLSGEVRREHEELKAFLRQRLYRHERVVAMNRRARSILAALFDRYLDDPKAMPKEHATRALAWQRRDGQAGRARAVADYVSGMTDRYAVSAYRRLVDPHLEW